MKRQVTPLMHVVVVVVAAAAGEDGYSFLGVEAVGLVKGCEGRMVPSLGL